MRSPSRKRITVKTLWHLWFVVAARVAAVPTLTSHFPSTFAICSKNYDLTRDRPVSLRRSRQSQLLFRSTYGCLLPAEMFRCPAQDPPQEIHHETVHCA